MSTPTPLPSAPRTDFIRAKVAADNASGKYGGRVVTRFPPEPNGYPHIGHAKSICLNFGLALENGGRCHLRYDDTNPETEDQEYVDAILRDVRWLGFDPAPYIFYASDYYEQLYDFALELIRRGRAYVCPLNEEQIREYRGTVEAPGRPSPGRDHTVEQNLDLFTRMRAGEFPDGAYTLRARIDMAADNMKLRDPLLYRIRHASHYRAGDKWCIYPMYDYAHPLSDAIEKITHSICTLEFENNRAIYDWLMWALDIPTPAEQTEFARLALTGFLMSKRKLLQLVGEKLVTGWDDPRMPTLSGLRRRGYTPSGIRLFCDKIGIAKANSVVDNALLEECLRDDLNPVTPRVLCVLRPLKVTLTTWPEGHVEWVDAPLFPTDVPGEGNRRLPITREIYVEQDDFQEAPAKGWHRLAPGAEVRLRHAFVVRCDEVVKDSAGNVVELRCSHTPPDAPTKKVKGTLHWVSASHSLPVEVRLYEGLFNTDRPGEAADVKDELNPTSLVTLRGARIEPAVATDATDTRYQFERQGYFWRDPTDSRPDALVFNRIVALKDAWARQSDRAEPDAAKPAKAPAGKPGAVGARPELSPEASARRDGLVARFRLDAADAERIAEDADLAAWFATAASAADPLAVARWVVNELLRDLKGRTLATLPLTPLALGRLVALQTAGTLTVPAAKKVYAELVASGGDPDAIVARDGLARIDDPAALAPMIAEVLASAPNEVAAYRAGKAQLIGFFVGRVLKASGGRADPALVQSAVRAALEG